MALHFVDKKGLDERKKSSRISYVGLNRRVDHKLKEKKNKRKKMKLVFGRNLSHYVLHSMTLKSNSTGHLYKLRFSCLSDFISIMPKYLALKIKPYSRLYMQHISMAYIFRP